MYCEKCGNKLTENHNFCPNCGNNCKNKEFEVEEHQKNEVAVMDKFSYEKIITFLENAKVLEQHKFTLQETVRKLNIAIQKLNYSTEVKCNTKSAIEVIVFGFIAYAIPVALIGVGLSIVFGGNFWGDLLFSVFLHPDTWKKNFEVITMCEILLLGFLMLKGIITAINNSSERSRYKQELEIAQADYNFRMYRISEIRQEIEKYNREIQSVNSTLEKLYSLGVIHNKYCSLIPIVTIYEYFEVGRCSTLRGESGAYNIYENESRQNMIIDQLDEVIIRLDMIQQNQYMLYEALETANQISNEIASQNEKLIRSQSSIASNTAAIAFNSKVIADNTRISAYSDAFFND